MYKTAKQSSRNQSANINISIRKITMSASLFVKFGLVTLGIFSLFENKSINLLSKDLSIKKHFLLLLFGGVC